MTDTEFEKWYVANLSDADHPPTFAWLCWQAATAAERERCRILCNRISLEFERQGRDARAEAAEECAAAIRRGE